MIENIKKRRRSEGAKLWLKASNKSLLHFITTIHHLTKQMNASIDT